MSHISLRRRNYVDAYWRRAAQTHNQAINYFKGKIKKYSPNTMSMSTHDLIYELGLSEEILLEKPLTKSKLDRVEIETLDIYEQSSGLNSKLNFIDILGKGVDGRVYHMEMDDNTPYALKKMPIIRPGIYARYALIRAYFNTDDVMDKQMIFLELLRHFKYVNQEEYDYFAYPEFEPVRRIISDIVITCKTFPVMSSYGHYERELKKIFNFYKHICINNIIRPHSDANNDVLATYFLSELVLDKKTPAFPLLYTSFKTNQRFTCNRKTFDIRKQINHQCKDEFDQYVYPYQYMAMEKLDMTLSDLINSPLFDRRFRHLQEICKNYLDVYAQIIFALLTAQISYAYVHNDLHAGNVMIKEYKGPLYYVIDKKVLDILESIEPLQGFELDNDGNVIFKLDVKVGICKIIDNGRSFMKTDQLDFGSMTNSYVARSDHINDYDHTNFNNDLLRFFAALYDPEFFDHLEIRREQNLSSDLEKRILDINSEVFFCYLDDEESKKDLFHAYGRCGNDKQCRDLFMKYGVLGFGKEPRCDIKEQRTPLNLIKYLDHFVSPNTNLNKVDFYFDMI